MSSGTPSETETLLPSTPDGNPALKSDGGRDVPVFIDSFKRNIIICKSLLGLGLVGSLGVEIWCTVQTFVKHSPHQAARGLDNFLLWEKVTNVACVALTVRPLSFAVSMKHG
jgi:hypothetical protein